MWKKKEKRKPKENKRPKFDEKRRRSSEKISEKGDGKERDRNTKNFVGVGSQDLNIEITLEKMARRWCQVNVDINFLLKREIYSPFFGSYHSAFFKLDGISELNQL